VKALRDARDGGWSAINKAGSTTVLNRKYLTLYVDHGTDPTNGTYACLLLPGATATQTQARAAATGWPTILASTDDQHGVIVPSLGFTGVNFWFGGTAGDLVASSPCCVMISERSDSTAVICVSDPMRMQTSLTLTWNRAVSAVTTAGVTQKITVTLG
jgi:hyaluronate lyase